MALDHYVSQVHLKNFYSPDFEGKKMYGVSKKDLRPFPCGSEDVCRIEEGNTNKYLEDERAIEEFLREIEPKYNKSKMNLEKGNPSIDDVYVMAGFVAYVSSCSPTAMRLHSPPLKESVASTLLVMEKKGALPPMPAVLGKSVAELISRGGIEVDGKFPQAIGISGVREAAAIFGNFTWEILINEFPFSPFFTSDFPIATELTRHPQIINRIVPLAPNLAIRIIPDIRFDRADSDFSFKNFRFLKKTPPLKEVRKINDLIVKCAEKQVFYRNNYDWIVPFIAKRARFRVATVTTRIESRGGYFLHSTQHIEEMQNAP